MGDKGQAEEDDHRLLHELQSEIETLRSELSSKEDEIVRLKDGLASSSTPSPGPENLNDEVRSAVNHQHELQLSTALSRIRTLETSLYEAETSQHSLQKQIGAMEDELLQLRSIARTQKPYTFPRSDSYNLSNDNRRSSFSSQRSNGLPAGIYSSEIDESLPAATRHQRHVSLAMLQARIISESRNSSVRSPSHHPSTSAEILSPRLRGAHAEKHAILPAVQEDADRNSEELVQSIRRPQFLDESHVFWCASCKGDLIVL